MLIKINLLCFLLYEKYNVILYVMVEQFSPILTAFQKTFHLNILKNAALTQWEQLKQDWTKSPALKYCFSCCDSTGTIKSEAKGEMHNPTLATTALAKTAKPTITATRYWAIWKHLLLLSFSAPTGFSWNGSHVSLRHTCTQHFTKRTRSVSGFLFV